MDSENNSQAKIKRAMIDLNKILGFGEAFKLIKQAVEAGEVGFEREEWIVRLHKLGDRRVPGALFNLLDLEGNFGFWVGLAIARLGDKEEVLPLLIEKLQDPSTEVREHAMSALGNLAERPLDSDLTKG